MSAIQPEDGVMEENPYQPPKSEERARPAQRRSVVLRWVILASVVAMIIYLVLPVISPVRRTGPRLVPFINTTPPLQSSHP